MFCLNFDINSLFLCSFWMACIKCSSGADVLSCRPPPTPIPPWFHHVSSICEECRHWTSSVCTFGPASCCLIKWETSYHTRIKYVRSYVWSTGSKWQIECFGKSSALDATHLWKLNVDIELQLLKPRAKKCKIVVPCTVCFRIVL